MITLVSMGLSRALQHHSSKASILHCSAFFMVQLLHPYMTTGKIISSVQFSRSVMPDSLRPRGLQHTRLSCPSPIPGVAQTHVHRVSDAIQPSQPLLSPSPPYGKTIALIIQTFCLRSDVSAFEYATFVITFLPRNKHL